MATGPLAGVRIIELAGIGPCPFAGMMLADMGADVIVVERPAAQRSLGGGGAMNRGKRSLVLDLKKPEALEALRQLILTADGLIEGYRPGVMERLGLGPTALEAQHPRLVFGRVTGWGQTGPLAQAAGHDLNYVALSGLLNLSQRPGQAPTLPATVVGDMASGGLLLAFGMVCALLEAQRSGRGQVIDAAMLDGANLLGSLVRSLAGQGHWPESPAQNFFLHSSPFYDSFECSDGRFLSLGAIEPAFYRELLQRLDLADEDPAQQMDTRQWPRLRERVAARLREKPRHAWMALLEGTDACVAGVLSLDEAPLHPHQQARQAYTQVQGQWQANPAPRFSRSQTRAPGAPPAAGAHGADILASLQLAPGTVEALLLDAVTTEGPRTGAAALEAVQGGQ
ncbi:CaiB/BaiF CoA-transferase family protein [Pelomonas sp. APW6]|uniref:CaiB/BaiF CoA-transferase family protein n=1 Tax=Roseateles subflavus TaxID=3053353 RepID=A0ABT7LHJ1_9BURK|nr:CaiB/BaiF CoA-transferase family protein [Pelomonas sp. APW6]MDL5032327.1 CaiB/BaiF CoA-transferase family protein [Pelomonas sp. APW6]